MNLIIILIMIPVLKAQNNWELKWSDEFDDEIIDQNKWEIDVQDSETCDPQKIGRLNCFTNNTRNLRLVNGSVSITAIQEKWINKKFTSAWIKTKMNFTFGKLVIRAALPTGKLLSPWVKMVPVKLKNRDGFVKKNQVILFYNDQTNWIRQEMSLGKKIGNVEDYLSNGNLNEYHSYSIEWNETGIIWKFDETVTNHVNLNGTISWLNEPVILYFYLRVGGQPFRNAVLPDEDVDEWECSSYIMDYVRYYQWTNEVIKENQRENNSNSPSDICKLIMDEIRPIRADTDSKSTNMTIIGVISGVCLILLITLIPLIVWLVFRMKKLRKSDQRKSEHEYYYDDLGVDGMEMYMEIPKGLYNEYEDPYQAMAKNNENYYADTQVGPTPMKIETTSSDYITMTKASVNTPL